MNKKKPKLLLPTIAAVAAATAAVAFLPSCDRQTGGGSGGAVELKGPQKSDHFEAVSAHLDLGGEIYVYVDVDGDVEKLASMIDKFLDYGRKASGGDMPTVLAALDVKELADDLGLSGIAALGMSSYKNGELYRNNYYLHVPDGRKGLLEMAGGEAAPFAARKLAPSGSDLIMEQDVDLKSGFELVESLARKLGGAEAVAEFRKATRQPLDRGLDLTAADIFGHLDTKLTVIGAVHPDKPMTLPEEVPVKMPSFDLLIALDGVGPIVTKMVASIPPKQRAQMITEGDGIQEMRFPLPPEVSKIMQPVIRHEKESGRVLLASSSDYLEKCLSGETTVWDDDTFKAAMEGLPDEGNGMSFVSAEFMNEYLRVYGDMMRMMAAEEGEMQLGMVEMAIGLMSDLGLKPDQSQARVVVNLPEGIHISENSGASAKQGVVAMGVGAVAVFAAITVPTLGRVEMEAIEAERRFRELEIETERLHRESLDPDVEERSLPPGQGGIEKLIEPGAGAKLVPPTVDSVVPPEAVAPPALPKVPDVGPIDNLTPKKPE